MTSRFVVAVLLIVGPLAPGRAAEVAMNDNDNGVDHSDRHTGNDQAFAFGRRGDAENADRTIRLQALDTMRYSRSEFAVRAGETVRFIVTNAGKIRHELVIGDAAEHREHEQEMQRMHGMEMHDEANGISLAPGETKTIVWRFDGPGTVQLACHEPGHYAAGMVSRVNVRR